MNIAFLVYGCRLNQAEAEGWRQALEARGANLVSPDAPAVDALCAHTCAVTAPAAREALRALRAFRAKHPAIPIIVSGCAAALLPPGLADLTLPHARKADWLGTVCDRLGLPHQADAPEAPAHRRTRAALIAQDGCDAFCAYCIVPHMRGAPVSVPMADLLRRADALLAEGYPEIVLTGCNLALYRDPETGASLPELLARLTDLPRPGRFRLGSLEPCVADDDAILRLIATNPGRLCPFLHLPIQSGSAALLRRTGRPYGADRIRALLDRICATLPYCGLGADWIAGLPGETEADATDTLALLRAYPFTGAHVFPYSRRPGTPAADWPDQLPSETIAARAATLRQAANEVRQTSLRRFRGRELLVIPETCRDDYWRGHSAEGLLCLLPGPATRGRLTSFIPTALTPEGFLR